MPLFMDRHDVSGITPEDAAQAHMADLAIQSRYGVRYLSYWLDAERETVFCLADAPNIEAAQRVHSEAHGLLPSEVIEVDPEMVERFLGKIYEPQPGEPIAETAFRAILFTDIVGSTELTQRLGDAASMKILAAHDEAVRMSLRACGGLEVKHMGDGIMASFRSVVRAAEAAMQLQRRLAEVEGSMPPVRVGLSAGEPVTANDDLFGATVQLAARLCGAADPGGIFASSAVKELALGKGLAWNDRGDLSLKGFEGPIRVHELLYR